ncbi:MAG: methyltransferase domain-containing protein [Desulfonatronovibrionaceae bacterium]
MGKNQRHVIIVDGYSTGKFYIDLLEKRKIPAVHVRSFPKTENVEISDMADGAISETGHRYAALVNGCQDMEELIRELREYNPVAILPGCETGVELANSLASGFGLPGNEPESGKVSRDKYLMHRAVDKAGVKGLKSWLGDDIEALQKWVGQIGLPVVLKPHNSSGADGVHICRNEQEVQTAFNSLFGSRNILGERITEVLAQEFAPGREVVINTVSCKGKHVISDLWRYKKIITSEGRSVYDGSELVRDFGAITDQTLDYAFSVLDALHIKQGPAHMEVMLTENGPILIECGARPMGAGYPQELLRESLGYTQLELSLESYLEPEIFYARINKPYRLKKHFFIKILVASREGNIESVPGVSLLASLPSVRSGNLLSCFETDTLKRTVDLLSAPGSIFLCHENPEILAEDLNIIRAMEKDAQNLLVALSSCEKRSDKEWFKKIPDDQWLKSDEEAKADAMTVLKVIEKHSEGWNVLDCPCGSAGVSFHLAKKGFRVSGIDLNPNFIEKAEKRFSDAGLFGKFQVLDMREINMRPQFDVVLNWFNSIGYFDIETDFDILKRMAEALVPGGILILEAPNRANALANTRAKTDEHGRELQKYWDDLSEKMYIPMKIGPDKDSTVIVGAYLYSLAQFGLLFRLVGLKLEKIYDENLSPFENTAKRMILVGRKGS